MKLETKASVKFILCQKCKAVNELGIEFCSRCGTKLLIVKGVPAWDEQPDGSEMGEHLLERISSLEENFRKQEEKLNILLEATQRQEQGLMLDLSGFLALMEVLERWRILDGGEIFGIWEDNLRQRITEIELRELFFKKKNTILSGFKGKNRATFRKFLSACEEQLLSGDSLQGIDSLAKALKHDPRNAELLFLLGDFHHRTEDSKKAEAFLKRCLKTEPRHLQALLLLGYQAYERNVLSEAEELFSKAAHAPGAGHLPRLCQAFIYAKLGEYDEAEDFLSESEAVCSTAESQLLHGYIFCATQRYTPAIRFLNKALKSQPRCQEARYLLGVCYIGKKQSRKARTHFFSEPLAAQFRYDFLKFLRSPLLTTKRRRKTKDRAGAGSLRAQGAKASSDNIWRKKLAEYVPAIHQHPADYDLLKDFILFCLDHDFPRHAGTALERFRQLPLSAEDSAWMNTVSAYLMSREGKGKAARDILRQTLDDTRKKSTLFLSNYELAREIADADDDLDEALKYANRSLQAAGEKGKHFSLALLGWIHFKKGADGEAEKFFSRARTRHSSPELAFYQALSLLRAGKDKKAQSLLMEAFKESLGFFHLHSLFGKTQRGEGIGLERNWKDGIAF